MRTLGIIKRRNFHLAEIEILLDALPHPALLYDDHSHRTVLGNLRAAELTAYTRTEFNSLPLDSLFKVAESSDSAISFIHSLQEKQCTLELVKRNGIRLGVDVTVTPLDANRTLLLLTLEPVSLRDTQAAEQDRLNRILEAWLTFSNIDFQSDLGSSLDTILQTGKALTGASGLCLYQANSEEPILRQTSSHGETNPLPETITPQELVTLTQNPMWVAGKRATSNLHRLALASNINYLAAAPIGQSNAVIGVLIITGDQSAPPPYLQQLLVILSKYLYTLIQGYSLIAQLKRSAEEQASLNAIQSALSNSVKDGIILLAPDLTVTVINPAAEQSLGYSLQEIQGHSVENILIGCENLVEGLEIAKKGVSFELPGNNMLYRRNGLAFPAQIRLLPILEGEKLVNIVTLFQDLSEQEQYRALNQQLEQRALLGEVTASFAHEIRNPINNISTGLQLLAFNLPQNDPNQDNIRRLQNDCERLAELVKSSLSFVRPMEYRLEPIDLGKYLSLLLERWQVRLDRANIKYHTQFEDGLPAIEGDARALEQVFTNLFTNAIQAMEGNGGALAVKARRVASSEGLSHIEVSVSDTGPGIPPEIRDRIFEPFFTTKQSGTGLGLAIIKRIITAHKGVISVDCIPGGTIFRVMLPALREKSKKA